MDISNTSWKENNEGNIEPSPRGLPSGSNPSVLYPTVRYIMGGIKRSWSRSNVMVASTGTGGVWHLAYEVGPANGLVKGEVFRFFAHAASAGATTLNVNFNTARPIVNAIGEPLVAGDIVAGQVVSVTFDGTSFRLLSDRGVSPKFAGTITAGTLDVTGNTKVGGTLAATGATTLKVLTADATTLASVTVSGASTLQAVTATTVAASSNATIGGTLAVGSTLDVTGATTLASATITGALAAGSATVAGSRVLTLADVGATKGLDADLLDGQHGAFYQTATNLNAGTLPAARLAGNYSITSLTVSSGITGTTTLDLRAGATVGLSIASNGTVTVAGTGGDTLQNIRQRAINAQAAADAKLALVGGTLSGDVSVTKANPRYYLHYPGVKNASWVMDSAANLIWQDSTGQNHFYITASGRIWSQEFNGFIHDRIEARAAAYAQNAVNNANGKFENIRLTGFTYVSGNDFTTAASGYVCTGIRRDPGHSTSVHGLYIAQLQGFSPSRGWVACFND